MATCLNDVFRNKPWQAKRQRGEKVFSLGMYTTRKEAERVEQQFDEFWPPRRNNGRMQRM